MKTKKSQLKTIVILVLILISVFVIAVFAINQSLNLTSSPQDAVLNIPALAGIINGKSVNTVEAQNYIKWYNNFSLINFEDVGNKTEISVALQVGNFDHVLKGLVLDNKKYTIELVACDERTKGCSFKINGIDTGKVYSSEIGKEPKTFSLNDNYELEINSIIFDFCDNKRFCDTHFEAYDLVDLGVIRR